MANATHRMPTPAQAGLTLIELLLALALGLGAILTALALLTSVKNGHLATRDHALIQDNARYAQEVIAQALRQANFAPRDDPSFAALDLSRIAAGVTGLDNSLLGSRTPDLSGAQANHANHRSDVLAIRYFGSADKGMLNCAGFPVAAPERRDVGQLENQRGWSIFYIATGSTGEPELRCKFRSDQDNWMSAAVVPGVEALRVLYGVSDTAGGSLLQFLPASRMTPQQWRQVAVVRFALLLRAEYHSGHAPARSVYPMFGAASPPDAVVTISNPRQTGKLRQVFDMSVRLRNPAQ